MNGGDEIKRWGPVNWETHVRESGGTKVCM